MHGLDVVAVGIAEEAAVVAGVVLRPDPRLVQDLRRRTPSLRRRPASTASRDGAVSARCTGRLPGPSIGAEPQLGHAVRAAQADDRPFRVLSMRIASRTPHGGEHPRVEGGRGVDVGALQGQVVEHARDASAGDRHRHPAGAPAAKSDASCRTRRPPCDDDLRRTPMTSLPRALSPLRHSRYRLLVASMALSLLAAGLWAVAVVWQVVALRRRPRGAVARGRAGRGRHARHHPAGRRAGRPHPAAAHPARRPSCCRAASMAVVAALSLRAPSQLWQLAGMALVSGLAMGLYYPAYSALVPALVPEGELLAVNGLEGMVRPVLQNAAGPAAAGLLVAALSPGAALAATAVASLLAAACLWALPTTPVRRDPPADGASRDRPAGRRPRGLRLHGAHAVAVGHAAVRVADAPGLHRPARGAGPVRDQGRRRRPRAARVRAGRVRRRRGGRLARGRLVPAAPALPHRHEPAVGAGLRPVGGLRLRGPTSG